MPSSAVLNIMKPVMCILPEVTTPERKVPFREKVPETWCRAHVHIQAAQIGKARESVFKLLLPS